ncbi:MAG: PQQ-dependent sugar dehydrogenase [Anaerolineae bacterium]|nr:PQQ-dependent sugar dehydrogenase [Phycisphaerae bacterium]
MPCQSYTIDSLEQRVLLSVLPAGFNEAQVASEIPTPTAMVFAPDGRLFLTQQAGQIRIIKNGQLNAQNFATVLANPFGERGLLGITLDPTFGQPGGQDYVYVYYTTGFEATVNNRISRFLADGDVAAGAEEIILDLPVIGPNESGPIWHMGGSLNFGPDGKLYVAQGDGQDPNSAQSLDNLKGKILRLNSDGSIPTDNPFYDSLDGINRSIWAYGLRNPFTTAFEPGSDRFYLNEVGQDVWEEINVGAPGANYGWPLTEGDFDNAEFPDFTRPFLTYHHSIATCVVGGAFYQADNFPSQYHGQYFFGDYTGGWIKTLDPDTGALTPFATDIDWITGLKLAPDGTLWYMTRGIPEGGTADGSVYMIQYTASNAPFIAEQPKDQIVAVGESVTFSVVVQGAAPFEFQWQRNGIDVDGASSDSYTIASTTFADSGDGFRCIITNNFGTATSVAGTLTVANTTRPVPTINSPIVNAQYSGGETIQYDGAGWDEQDGALPDSAFTWRVDLHHDQHAHPFVPPTSGARSGSFVIPTVGETSDNVWYRIHLTVTDSQEFSTTTFRDIHPRKATVAIDTNIPGLAILLDGQPQNALVEVLGVQGITRLLDAPLEQTIGGKTYQFVDWSDGGDAQHTIAFPSADTVYTAFYRYVSPTAKSLVLHGSAGDDQWILRLATNGLNLQVFRTSPNDSTSQLIPLSSVDTITVNGLGGDDVLTLDGVNGAFKGIGKITFAGGANATASGDLLRIVGTNLADSFDITTDGVFFNTLPVEYGGVENLGIDLAAGDDVLRVNDTPDALLTFDSVSGSNVIDFFGGEQTIDTDLGNVAIGVHNDAIVNFTTKQHLAAFELTGNSRATFNAGGTALLRTGSLNIEGHGTLDLNDNGLLLDYADASQLNAVQAWIHSGRAGGAWTGEGIVSTTARDANPRNLTLGTMEASDYRSIYGPAALFAGEAIDDTAALVKFTYYGDTDFNGVVDFDDYSRIDSGFTNNRTGWLNGDVDGNGVIDFDDYSLIDQAFHTQSAPLRPAVTFPLPARKPARGA